MVSSRNTALPQPVLLLLLLLLVPCNLLHPKNCGAEAARVLAQSADDSTYFVQLLPSPSPAPSPSPSPSPSPPPVVPGLYVTVLPPSTAPPSSSPSPSPSPSPTPSPTAAPSPSPQQGAEQRKVDDSNNSTANATTLQQEAGQAPINSTTTTPATTTPTNSSTPTIVADPTPPTAQTPPAQPPATPPPPTSSSSLSTGALIGIIVGSVGGLILLVAVCTGIISSRRKCKDAKDAARKAGGGNEALLPAFGPNLKDPRGSFPGAGGSSSTAAGVMVLPPPPPPHGLPAAATVPVPPRSPTSWGSGSAAEPQGWSSGPAALADTNTAAVESGAAAAAAATTAAAAAPLAHAAPSPDSPPAAAAAAAAAARLEGWLAHSAAAATPVLAPGGMPQPHNPDYPVVCPRAAAGSLSTSPPAAAAAQHNRAAPQWGVADSRRPPPAAIPEDAPVEARLYDSTAIDTFHYRSGGDAPEKASTAQQWASSSSSSREPRAAPDMQQQQRSARRVSWEGQQQQYADDTAPVADIAASPFAYLFGATPAGDFSSSAVMSRDASGPLSPVRPSVSCQAGSNPGLPWLGGGQPAAAAPAGSTSTAQHGRTPDWMVPSTTGAARGEGNTGRQWAAAAADTSTAASPFAAALPALGDNSLSAAVTAVAAAAAAADAAARHRSSSHTSGVGQSQTASNEAGSSDRHDEKPGAAHVVRFSTDTGSSSSAVRSWTSSSTSSAAAASSSSMSAHPAHPAQPRHAAAAGGAAVTPPRPAARVQHAATAPAPHVDRPSAAVAAAGPMGRAASDPSADVGLVLQASVAPRGGVHFMSGGPQQDQHWDFGRFGGKDVRVLLQVNSEDAEHPVSLILMCSAPPPRPEVLAQVVLVCDPPQAGVNLSIDAVRDLAFPTNSFLGCGAFGQVHRALYLGRHPVAVKMLTDPNLRSADDDTLRSFREELSIMARLQHPHILRCFGGNLEVANPFIVTELCECSLDKMILYFKQRCGTGLPLRHTLTVGLHVAAALWHMHPSIVHRDLKPANVLLINGVAKVGDFGLSRMKMHTYLSTQHVAAGTASYMSPETFSGGAVGEKADVWSLACMLWECVTGERPWRGLNVVQVAFQVAMAKNKPELLRTDPAICPPELAQLIDDCFAFNPRERPSSGEIMKLLAQMIRVHCPDIVRLTRRAR